MGYKLLLITVLLGAVIIGSIISMEYLNLQASISKPSPTDCLMLQIANGTCNVIIPTSLHISATGSYWSGPILFSSSNYTECVQWADLGVAPA